MVALHEIAEKTLFTYIAIIIKYKLYFFCLGVEIAGFPLYNLQDNLF